MVDLLLRLASIVILASLVHQLFFSTGGSDMHVGIGKFAMFVGAAIAILVAIRGVGQEVFTPLYIAHLIVGGLWFACLFLTGLSGWTAYRTGEWSNTHYALAKVTGLLLIGTLTLGVISRLSH